MKGFGMDEAYLNGRLAHLKNRMISVNESLFSYGETMPSAHREYKIREMIPCIKRAIQKISVGSTYGICEGCHDRIDQRRLEKIPEARLCSSCQAIAERKG